MKIAEGMSGGRGVGRRVRRRGFELKRGDGSGRYGGVTRGGRGPELQAERRKCRFGVEGIMDRSLSGELESRIIGHLILVTHKSANVEHNFVQKPFEPSVGYVRGGQSTRLNC